MLPQASRFSETTGDMLSRLFRRTATPLGNFQLASKPQRSWIDVTFVNQIILEGPLDSYGSLFSGFGLH